jgi:hypothetical protein
MVVPEARRVHPELKQLVVEASRALACLDAVRLEELAFSCQALNREGPQTGAERRIDCIRQAKEAQRDMEVFAQIIAATRANLNVMNRIRELRKGRLEYGEREAHGWGVPGSSHGNN